MIGDSDWLYRIARLFFDVVVVLLQVHGFLAAVTEFVVVFAGAFVDQMVVKLVNFNHLFASSAQYKHRTIFPEVDIQPTLCLKCVICSSTEIAFGSLVPLLLIFGFVLRFLLGLRNIFGLLRVFFTSHLSEAFLQIFQLCRPQVSQVAVHFVPDQRINRQQ